MFHVVLHQPEIPPNTGAVGRTCVALGADLWLVRPLGFRIDEKTRRRAGLDYWRHLNWRVVDNWEELNGAARASSATLPRFWMFTKTAETSLFSVQFQAGDWLVFGSETSGLPPSLLEQASRNVRIPVSGKVRSLNLSNAVAVAGYEAARQIGVFDTTGR